MVSTLAHVLLLTLLPVCTAALGAIVSTVWPPSSRVRSGIQHFAGGVVFSVVAVELLPDVMQLHSPLSVVTGFALGIAAMLGIRKWTEGNEAGEAPIPDGHEGSVSSGEHAEPTIPARVADAATGVAPRGMLVAVGIDIALDGVLLGVAFAAGAKEGLLLTLALSVEVLSLGLAIAASLLDRGASRTRSILTVTGLAALLIPGAIAGDTVLHNAPDGIMTAVLAFGCAALLFLVTEELLVEAHEVPETAGTTTMFFAGFLLFLVLGMLA